MRAPFPQEGIDALKAQGCSVYMRNRGDTWVIFERGNRVAYAQYGPSEGYSVSTVHVPNRESGTGYQIARHVGGLYPNDVDTALCGGRPSWALQDGPPKRYDGIEAYRAASAFNAQYQLV